MFVAILFSAELNFTLYDSEYNFSYYTYLNYIFGIAYNNFNMAIFILG